MPLQIKANDTPIYISIKIQVFRQNGIKPVTDTSYNLIGQTIAKRPNYTLEELFIEQERDMGSPKDRVNNALIDFEFLKMSETGSTAAKKKQWILERPAELDEQKKWDTFRMEGMKCVVLRERFCLCFNRRLKAMDFFKIDKDQI